MMTRTTDLLLHGCRVIEASTYARVCVDSSTARVGTAAQIRSIALLVPIQTMAQLHAYYILSS
jgi:hypothetical protein